MPPASTATTDSPYSDTKSASAAAAAAEETRTNEELDTEVSQINTQSNNKTQSSEPAESYSRPMSRTSSMTPVIKTIFFFYFLNSTILYLCIHIYKTQMFFSYGFRISIVSYYIYVINCIIILL